MNTRQALFITTGILLVAMALMVTACSEEGPLSPSPDSGKRIDVDAVRQIGDTAPAGLTSVSLGDDAIEFWPYTGTSFDGAPTDPINVVFRGQADPLQIREALLALDGDRTAFGFPPVPPFNQVWLDALGGDVQTTYTEGGDGWTASIIQLTLGDYGPLRAHLRLFHTGVNGWTLGGAHFEMQIPGTTEHQVLSWEIAEQLVLADLMRTGLLDPDMPMVPTGPINAAPSFRTITAMIYNLLPPELIYVIGGPPQPVTDDVPLPSDGEGMIVNLAGALPVTPGTYENTTTVVYDQLVPRPFCATGPGDYLYVTGPVDFHVTTTVTANGIFQVSGGYKGEIGAQPMDLSTGVPTPVGLAFTARVDGSHRGQWGAGTARITARDNRLTHEAGGPQKLVEFLTVPEHGEKIYRAQLHCLDVD